jgi:phage FluMu protein Com
MTYKKIISAKVIYFSQKCKKINILTKKEEAVTTTSSSFE